MKSSLGIALTFFAVAMSPSSIAQTPDPTPHRGSIQIQGPDIEQNYRNGQGTISKSWAQATPLTKKEGRQQLAILENTLTQKQKDIRRSALDSGISFINSCSDKGCSALSRSYPGNSSYRVDIEIKTGLAFTGTAPQ
jgi:hypothetical protein